MTKLEIIEEAKRRTKKEYSWWSPGEVDELFAMEIINLMEKQDV